MITVVFEYMDSDSCNWELDYISFPTESDANEFIAQYPYASDIFTD